MKYLLCITLVFLLVFSVSCGKKIGSGCLVGAFIADKPDGYQINNFKSGYGKKPFFIMVFVDWGKFIPETVSKDVYENNSVLFITWEPWYAREKKAIDYDGLLSGKYDGYIESFSDGFKVIKKDVFLRFAHEMNGDWYPWSGAKLGKDKYIAVTKHIRDIFNRSGVTNVKWVFSINWENIPKDNKYYLYYPGDNYVDYIGIDGYNWGDAQSWSKWRSFKDIFSGIYKDIIGRYDKPVLVSEFSSSSQGGDKTRWIAEAFKNIRNMPNVKGFILFNIDKETDFSFPADTVYGKELKKQLRDPYFIEIPKEGQ